MVVFLMVMVVSRKMVGKEVLGLEATMNLPTVALSQASVVKSSPLYSWSSHCQECGSWFVQLSHIAWTNASIDWDSVDDAFDAAPQLCLSESNRFGINIAT